MQNIPVTKQRGLLAFEVLALVGYTTMSLWCLLLIIYLRVNRREAFTGDIHASRKVILPAFEPVLWVLLAITGIYVVFFCIAIKVQLYIIAIPNIDRECFYAGRQFVFVLVIVYLRQKSLSGSALSCAITKSLLLSTYTLPIVSVFTLYTPHNSELLFLVKLGIRRLLLVVVVYACMISPPAGRAKPRAFKMHGWFIVIYHVFQASYSISQQYYGDSIWYPLLSYMVLVWSSIAPLLIWALLRADTEYWRGMSKRVCSLQLASRLSRTNSLPPPSPVVNEGISSRGIHVLIEMHRDILIDFSQLELKRKLSSDTSVVMFSGSLSST